MLAGIDVEIIELYIVAVLLTMALIAIVFFALRLKKCPSDKIMVISGKLGKDKDGNPMTSVCLHGGVRFVWPLIQQYSFLDLTPFDVEIKIKNALTRQKNHVNVDASFCLGISTEPECMRNAAERLLGLERYRIEELAKEIIMGQMRLAIAETDIEEIDADRDKFLESLVFWKVENEIKQIGLRLININISELQESNC